MKIVLIAGASGSGKTTICQKLCQSDSYNYINSYTDRSMRNNAEWGHVFVKSLHMDNLLEENDIVAKTIIEDKRYCTLRRQFKEDKINIYVVDYYGINDTIKSFPDAEFITILIDREEVNIDCIREGRDVCLPRPFDVDFFITNNGDIDTCVKTIDKVINLDLYHKPNFDISIDNKIEYIDEQRRHLLYIRESLLYQIWYNNYDNYIDLINNVSKKINNDFEFDITIEPDLEPDIDDGFLIFNITAKHNGDIDWTTMHNLVEKLSYHGRKFCEDNNYDDLKYRLRVSESMIMEYD